MKKFFMFLAMILMILSINSTSFAVKIPERIKIGLIYDNSSTNNITIQSNNGLEIGEIQNGNFVLLQEYYKTNILIVQKQNNMIQVLLEHDNNIIKSNLVFRPKATSELNLIVFNNKKYRGNIEVKLDKNGNMLVINDLPIEEYIYGVVARELGGTTQMEALKVQAVIARTYALTNYNKRNSSGYNLRPTTEDQAYSGYSWENSRVRDAVDATKSQVVTYKGKLVESTPYCASIGEWTEDSTNVWSSTYFPYLTSVENKYESLAVKNINWTIEVSKDTIKKNLLSRGIDIGDVKYVKVLETSKVGTVTKLLIQGDAADKKKIYEKEWARIGLKINLPSQWYNVTTDADINITNGINKITTMAGSLKIKNSNGTNNFSSIHNIYIKGSSSSKTYATTPNIYKFNGKGNGHSVGLSQNGAIGMAMSGFTYDNIIKHYYSGTEIENAN